MPLKFIRIHYHPAGEFKFEDHHSISISPCTPSELGALCDEIELRNLGQEADFDQGISRHRTGNPTEGSVLLDSPVSVL